jgi:hypothetical protein
MNDTQQTGTGEFPIVSNKKLHPTPPTKKKKKSLEIEIRIIKKSANKDDNAALARRVYIQPTFLSVLNFLFGAELPSSAPKAWLGFLSI